MSGFRASCIGTLEIPSLGISMKVWEGESAESMKKGLGHYSSTSAWDGNVGLCGSPPIVPYFLLFLYNRLLFQ